MQSPTSSSKKSPSRVLASTQHRPLATPAHLANSREFLPQAHDRAQSPHTTKVNGHADRRGHMLETSSPATSADATTALGTSAPSQAGRAMWMVGSAPVPSNSGRGRFDGFLLNQPAPPLTKPRSPAALEPESDFSAATNGPALDSEARLTPLRLLAPFQSNYSSGELNVVGEDENENEGDEAKTTAAMNGAGSAYHHTTNFHPDHFENGRSGSAGKVSGLVGLGFKVGSRDDAVCEGMAPHIAPATEEFHATLVGNGITAAQDDDDDDP
ncbi:unnamed protein product [Tilletia caries]|nr:unnamed protein product [Tilletia caries]CAD7063601.1 unnamed protein product [Tilletia caries]